MSVKSPNLSDSVTGILWARESNQYDKNEYTLDAQIETGRAHAERDGVAIQYTFREKFSGVDLWQMPELTRLRMLLQATSGKKIIYCHAQDRLVRGEEGEDIFWLLVEFRRYGAEVRFHLNPVDLSSIAGKIQVLIAGNDASNEIAKILDRTWTRGKLRRIKEGKIPNFGREKFGFRRDRSTGKAEIEPGEAVIVRRIFSLVTSDRLGALHISRKLNDDLIPTPHAKYGKTDARWSAATIRLILRDPAYKGEGAALRYKNLGKGKGTRRRAAEDHIQLPDAYPALVSAEQWQTAQDILDQNCGDAARNETKFSLLRGRVFCAKCGRKMFRTPHQEKLRDGGKRYRYYFRCASDFEHARDRTIPKCGGLSVREERLEEWVWGQVQQLLNNPDRIIWPLSQAVPADRHDQLLDEVALADAEIIRLTAQQRTLVRRLREAGDTVAALIQDEIEAAAREIEAQQRRAHVLRVEIAKIGTAEKIARELRQTCERLVGLIQDATPENKRVPFDELDLVVSADGKNWDLMRRKQLLDSGKIINKTFSVLEKNSPETKK